MNLADPPRRRQDKTPGGRPFAKDGEKFLQLAA